MIRKELLGTEAIKENPDPDKPQIPEDEMLDSESEVPADEAEE